MYTSAPEDAARGGHYFADYEVYDAGQRIAWGQVTHRSPTCRADDVIDALRDRAAHHHGVARGAIRLRCVCRL